MRFLKWLDNNQELYLIFGIPLGIIALILMIGHSSYVYIKNLVNSY